MIGLGLACTMLALSACGKGGDKNENAALAKEHVYKFQKFELPDMEGEDCYVMNSFVKDERVYMVMRVYHWSEEGSKEDIRLISMKEDGTDLQQVNLELPDWKSQSGNVNPMARSAVPEGGAAAEPGDEEGAEPEEGGEGTEPEGESGSEEGGEGTEPEGGSGSEEGEDTESGEDAADLDSEVDMPATEVYENSNYGNFACGQDGKLYGIRNYYYETYSPEYTSVQKNYISCWNMDGTFEWEKELAGADSSEDEYLYVNGFTVAADGTLTIMLSGNSYYKMTVDGQGNVSDRKELPDELSQMLSNGNLMARGDGTFLMMYYDDSWTKQYVATYDPQTDAVGQSSEIPSSMAWGGYNTISAGTSSDLIYTNTRGVYTYKIGDADVTEKMNFVNSDVNIADFSSLVELTDTSFIGIFRETYEDGMEAGLFTYVDPKDIPDKSVLVLAANYIDGDIKQKVVEFNRSNEKYRITLKEYDSYNTYDDYQAGYTQLNNDITSGNMPDILLTDGLPTENYVAKGLLADIGKLMEEDEEISQIEFVQSVLDAYSVDGKLYYVIPYFRASTMIGKESIVGDRTSWTMEDMKQLQAELPEGTRMLGEMTRESFMSTVMDYCGADFIDVASGKCNFDSQSFIDLMEFARELPETLEEPEYSEDYWRDYETQYRDNRTILAYLYISDLRSVNYSINGNFGEEVSYIGFPTESGMGAYVAAGESFAISAKSSYTEGAWEFLRYYLTDEYQSELSWGLPIQMKYFMEDAQEATQKPYYLDENGNKVEHDDYYYINGEDILLEPMTQAQVDKLVNYIFSINNCYYSNTDITNIINEEMPSYFSGQKSAQEVAKIIQSRAQIYVNERR